MRQVTGGPIEPDRTLTKHGHAREVGVEQEAQRPQRMRYALTPSGRRHYHALLQQAASTVVLPTAGIDVVLAAVGDLAPTEVVVDAEIEWVAHLDPTKTS